MRPRNKTERRVVELSATLPPLRQSDAERITRDYKKVCRNKGLAYYLILERCHEFQVIRYYYKTCKSLFEVAQLWFNKDKKVAMARHRYMRVDAWVRDSQLTLTSWFRCGHEYTYLGGFERLGWSGCFVRSLLPELKQRGLRTSAHGIHPLRLCVGLLHNNRLETLFKLRQYRLVSYFCRSYARLDEETWQSIRIALRHGYHWATAQEVSDWVDMIRDLQYLGLDTRNPHYICPSNLDKAHEHWRNKKSDKEEMEQRQREMEEAAAYEPTFFKNREQFMDMVLQKGKVTIQIIPTALAIKEEGIAMHHCVGDYYNRPDSLILSAKVEGKRMETIEVSLADYTIVQSRGMQNKRTNYHNQIVHIMKQGLPEIRRRNEQHLMKTAV